MTPHDPTKKDEKHGAVRRGLNKVQDTVGGVAGRASAAMVSSPDAFVKNATIGNLYEMEAAKRALAQSSSEYVKAFAKKMIEDHTTAKHQLSAALEMNETKQVSSPPQQLDERREKMLEHLKASPKKSFDSTYLDQQVLAHEETATLMNQYKEHGENSQLRSFAAGTVPVVERHLQLAKSIREHSVH